MIRDIIARAVKEVSGITLGTAVSDIDSVNRTQYTFTLGTGDAAANRGVLIGIGAGGGSTGTISSVLVDSNAATQLLSGTIDNEVHAGIYYISLPTGTSSSFVVNYSSSKGHCGMVVLPVYGADGTASDTLFSNANPGTGTIDVASGDVVFGYQVVSNGTDRTFVWTNLDELAGTDEVIETGQSTHSSAATVFTSGEAAKTITCTPSGTTSLGENLVVVAMGAA
jgi:hypothetical protein